MLHSRSLLPQQTHCSSRSLLHHQHQNASAVAVRSSIKACMPPTRMVCVATAAAAPGPDSASSRSRQRRSRPPVGSSSARDSPQHRSAAGGSKAGRSSRSPAYKPQQQQQGQQQQQQQLSNTSSLSAAASAAAASSSALSVGSTAEGRRQEGSSSTAGSRAGGSGSRRDSSTGTDRSAAVGKRKYHQPQQQQQQQQQQQHKRRQSPGATTRLCTLFSQTRSIKELQQLVQQHANAMTAIDLAAAYTQLGKFCQWDAAAAKTATAKQLLQQLDKLLPPLQQQLDARGLSNIIWGCAYARHPSVIKQLLPAFQQQVAASAANTQDISNVMWALATMEQQLPAEQCTTLVRALVQKRNKANPQAIANSLWAVGKMGKKVPEQYLQQLLGTLVAMVSQAKPRETATPQAISNSLWACAKFGYAPTNLLSVLEEEEQQTQVLLAAATPQALANMAWACGQLGYKGKLLPSALLQQASVLMQQHQGSRSFICQNCCNLCWSVAVLDMQQHIPSVLQLAKAVTGRWNDVVPENMRQLYQVHLWLQDCQLPTGGAGVTGVLTQQQLEQCRSSWEHELAAKTAVSKASSLQQSVFSTLQQLPATTWQQPPVMEQRTADGAFSIDIAAVTAAGVALAIEVDGPLHFVRPGNRVDGHTQYRNRALAARGYTVISIPYQKWDKLISQQRVQYLKDVLRL